MAVGDGSPSPSSSSIESAHRSHGPRKRRDPSSEPSQSALDLHGGDGANQLSRLLSHLLAAKRSLSSIDYAHQATNILSSARADLESTTILKARTSFLQQSLASQLRILRGIQYELEEVVHGAQAEYSSILKELDHTDKRLGFSIDKLKETKLEHGFQPSGSGPTDSQSRRDTIPTLKVTLHDFVDDTPVNEIQNGVKASIDTIQQAKRDVDRSLQDFEEDLQTLNNAAAAMTMAKNDTVGTTTSSASSSTYQTPDIPAILKDLESCAGDVAEGLESLVKHFDLCVTAIRHTEGGGAAVAKNIDVHELPDVVAVKDLEGPTQPITEDEKQEMMAVLEKDAGEVEDVVVEIQDRVSHMESQLGQVQLWKEKQETESGAVKAAIALLELVGSRLPGYLGQSQAFSALWTEERTKIEEKMAGLEDLRDVYRNFLHAYDGLIVEVARRKAVKNQMERVMREAQSKLRQLYESDLGEREVFRLDQGDFLPVDIWSGLSDPPPQYTFSRVGEIQESMPDLPRKTVESALKRLRNASPVP